MLFPLGSHSLRKPDLLLGPCLRFQEIFFLSTRSPDPSANLALARLTFAVAKNFLFRLLLFEILFFRCLPRPPFPPGRALKYRIFFGATSQGALYIVSFYLSPRSPRAIDSRLRNFF